MTELDVVPGTVRVQGVTKSFLGNVVLDHVDLDVCPGEVHALVGGNGSGKSTLVKVLAGVHAADHGTLRIGAGEEHDLRRSNPALAQASGLRFVHQERSTFPDLTVADNLALGRGFPSGFAFRIRQAALDAKARDVLARFGIDARPSDKLGSLRPSDQTMVAVARALQDDTGSHGLLVMDEATATLPPAEADLLMRALRRFAGSGWPVLFISHRLDEVLEHADRVTALRDGRLIGTEQGNSLSRDRLVDMIVGRALAAQTTHAPVAESGAAPLLQVTDLCAGHVQDLDLEVRPGEVVGLTGLAGSGCSTVLRALFGAQPSASGRVTLDGRVLRLGSTRDATRAGIGSVPADRAERGIFPGLTVLENLTVASQPEVWRGGRLRRRSERRTVQQDVRSFRVKADSVDSSILELSGGNQQKVVFARWVRRNPRLLLLDQPTQGVDIGSRTELWGLVREVVDRGAGVLVASSDVDELARSCDRVLVMNRGRLVSEVSDRPLTTEAINKAVHMTASGA
jgi:ribose transport system ATP-binding protein